MKAIPSNQKVNYTQTLADFSAKTNFEDLPADVIHESKRILLDTIGCGIGGYSLDRGKIVAGLARDLGGTKEATIFVTGDKVSCANAAFANADLANVLDQDETFLNCIHLANAMVANTLAVGERVKASGRDLITAFAVSFDVTSRLVLSIPQIGVTGKPPSETVEWTPVHGHSSIAVGGAVAAGKMLGLDKDRMADALGLAGASAPAPSLKKLVSEAKFSMQKYAQIGFLAQTGVISALLAEKGYTGDRTILDGDYGFWRFAGGAESNWNFLLEGLGQKWWILEDSIKPYPACRFLHGVLDLFYKIKKEQAIKPEEIESVTVRLHSVAMGDIPIARPSLNPEPNDLNLQFNMPYLISVAALGFKPGPQWHSPERLTDPRLLPLMRRVKVEVEPESIPELIRVIRDEPTKKFKKAPCSITVKARGKQFDGRAYYAKGDPWQAETRMSDREVDDKFRTLCYQILRTDKIEKAIEMVRELEKLDNISKLTELLSF